MGLLIISDLLILNPTQQNYPLLDLGCSSSEVSSDRAQVHCITLNDKGNHDTGSAISATMGDPILKSSRGWRGRGPTKPVKGQYCTA